MNFLYICKNIFDNILTHSTMAKYNITEKKEKEATYRTLVNPSVMDDLKERILEIIVIQKKYKDKNYTAQLLASDLGTNTRYISAVVNTRFHMSYPEFVNKHRIEEAMTLLLDARYQGLNMEDIAVKVGFANRQSFYASFFRFNTCTPREYKLRNLALHPALKTAAKKKTTKGRKKTSKK